MPRNYEKENEWQRMKYKQILFKVSAELAEEFRVHLAKHDMKPVEWFRYAVQLGIVAPEHTKHGTDISMKKCKADIMQDTDISISPFHELLHRSVNVKCARCGMPNEGYVDGYFRCIECDFGNYDPDETGEDGETQKIQYLKNTDISIKMAQDEPLMVVEELPKKKRRTVSPTPEMVGAWIEMHKSGMSYSAIAKSTEGYDSSTVRKRIAKELAKDDAKSGAD